MDLFTCAMFQTGVFGELSVMCRNTCDGVYDLSENFDELWKRQRQNIEF